MMRKKILFALGVVVLIITLFGLCGMLWAGMMLPGDNGKTSFGIYPAVPYPVVGLLLAFGLFALGAVKKGVHPLTVLPAFAASALWLCLSGTPVFSVTYKLTDPQILPSALMLLGLTGSLCALGLFAEKTAPFDLKQMLILLAIVPVLWALSRAETWANEMRQLSQPSMLDLRPERADDPPPVHRSGSAPSASLGCGLAAADRARAQSGRRRAAEHRHRERCLVPALPVLYAVHRLGKRRCAAAARLAFRRAGSLLHSRAALFRRQMPADAPQSVKLSPSLFLMGQGFFLHFRRTVCIKIDRIHLFAKVFAQCFILYHAKSCISVRIYL